MPKEEEQEKREPQEDIPLIPRPVDTETRLERDRQSLDADYARMQQLGIESQLLEAARGIVQDLKQLPQDDRKWIDVGDGFLDQSVVKGYVYWNSPAKGSKTVQAIQFDDTATNYSTLLIYALLKV